MVSASMLPASGVFCSAANSSMECGSQKLADAATSGENEAPSERASVWSTASCLASGSVRTKSSTSSTSVAIFALFSFWYAAPDPIQANAQRQYNTESASSSYVETFTEGSGMSDCLGSLSLAGSTAQRAEANLAAPDAA